MAQRSIEHEFPCTPEEYWDVFFLPEFNHSLFRERLRFQRWEITATEPTPGGFRRTVEAEPPPLNLPGPINAVLKKGTGYRETGEFQRESSRYDLVATSYSLPERLLVSGHVRVVPTSAGHCKRIYDAKVEAKIFGIGGMLEERVLSDLERSLNKAADHTRQWLERKRAS